MARNSRIVEKGKLDSGVKVGSKNWYQELKTLDSFRYVANSEKPYTVRKEVSRKKDKDKYIPTDNQYWYAYRKVDGRLHKRYIGQDADLTIERLEEIAAQLNIPPEPRKEKQVTDSSYVTSDEVKRLQQRVEELEAELQGKNEELAEASKKIESLAVELSTVRDESDKLHRELHNKSDVLDYQQLQKDYLRSLRLGKQSSEYKKADKHIKQFINLIQKQQ
jgi:hypothetical protein